MFRYKENPKHVNLNKQEKDKDTMITLTIQAADTAELHRELRAVLDSATSGTHAGRTTHATPNMEEVKQPTPWIVTGKHGVLILLLFV